MKIKILLSIAIPALLVIPLSITGKVWAVSSNNPIFATIEKVEQLISDATSSLQSQIDALTVRLDLAEDNIDGLDTRVTDLENAPSPSPSTQKELKIFDNNDNELGLFISRESFLYVPLGRIVVLRDAQIVERGDVWFQSTDCTGQAYALFSERDTWTKFNEIVPLGPDKYYIVDSRTPTWIGGRSLLRYSGGSFPCLSAAAGGNAWSLTPVSLPFTEPIALPLQYKYQ